MKIAALGDVHANLPALKAVLEHARQAGAEKIWNIGDFTGYGAFPDEAIGTLRQWGAVSITGNYDKKVLKIKKSLEKWSQTKGDLKVMAFNWAYDHLSPESRSYLEKLPEQQEIAELGWKILLCHGSPASINEHLGSLTPQERFGELAAMTPAKIIVCGHSHQAFARQVDGKLFLNTGTVGRPDDGDPRAVYALLDLQPGKVQVVHYRVPYPIQEEVDAIRAKGLPEEFSQMTVLGRSLDFVQSLREVGVGETVDFS